MSEKRHKINKFANFQNKIGRNSPAFHRDDFVPSECKTVDLWYLTQCA